MSTTPAAAKSEQYVLRFSEQGMRKAIKASAAINERSMNAEIIYLIKRGQDSVQAKEAQHEKQA